MTDVGSAHDHERIVLILHLFVVESACAEQIAATGFKPDEVVRVMNYTHLVRLGISDAYFGIVPAVHISRQYAVGRRHTKTAYCILPPAYWRKLAGRQGFEPR